MVSIKHLYQSLKKPGLWEPAPDPFWDDEHISRGMLAAHIDPDSDGASRRHEFIARSAQWITTRCPPAKGARLLDLGCGPGLYAEHFRQNGFTVFGMDLSPRSIEYARQNSCSEISYTCADYLQTALADNMDVVTLIYCDFGVLPPDARRTLLGRIFHALKPGGRLVFDVFTCFQYVGFEESGNIAEYDSGGFWSAEPHIVLERRLAYPEDHTFLHQVGVVTGNEFKKYHIWEHVFNRHELRSALHDAGFGAIDFYGDSSGSEASLQSKTLCVVAEK